MISLPFTLIAPLPLVAGALRKVARALLSLLTLTHGNETALVPRKLLALKARCSGQSIYTYCTPEASKVHVKQRGGRTKAKRSTWHPHVRPITRTTTRPWPLSGENIFLPQSVGRFLCQGVPPPWPSIQGKSVILPNGFRRNVRTSSRARFSRYVCSKFMSSNIRIIRIVIDIPSKVSRYAPSRVENLGQFEARAILQRSRDTMHVHVIRGTVKQ